MYVARLPFTIILKLFLLSKNENARRFTKQWCLAKPEKPRQRQVWLIYSFVWVHQFAKHGENQLHVFAHTCFKVPMCCPLEDNGFSHTNRLKEHLPSSKIFLEFQERLLNIKCWLFIDYNIIYNILNYLKLNKLIICNLLLLWYCILKHAFCFTEYCLASI
jgi:hypothetical protein